MANQDSYIGIQFALANITHIHVLCTCAVMQITLILNTQTLSVAEWSLVWIKGLETGHFKTCTCMHAQCTIKSSSASVYGTVTF